ncbi:MAG: hypothetical protein PPP58_06990 [Natronomonas sp.]
MKRRPETPTPADAPARLFESGHLWITELIDGESLRFQLRESGLLRFGDETRVYDNPDAVPDRYRHAVRHVRERLDRDALYAAVDDVESYVFVGVATHRQTIEYDFERLPSLLGFEIWDDADGSFRPPDAVVSIFDRLGLDPVNVFEQEVDARYFDPSSYEIPDSAWYDGPAAGVVVRNKRGDRAAVVHPRLSERPEPADGSDAPSAEEYVTDDRLRRLAADLEARGHPVTVDRLRELVLEAALRVAHRELPDPGTDRWAAFRSEVGRLTQAFLEDR